DGVIRNRGRDGARDNAVQSTRTGEAAKLKRLEQERGGRIERLNVRAGQAVVQSKAGEGKLAKRILRKKGEARAVLHVILDILRVDADLLLKQDGFLPSLVEVITRREQRETRGDGPVKKIRLGKAKHEAARQTSKLRGERERFAETEEIVGLVSKAD